MAGVDQRLKISDLKEVNIYSVTDGLSSRATKTNYRRAFRQFIEHFKTDEISLLVQGRESPRDTESMIISYVKHLARANLSHGSIHAYCFAIFHFYEMNDVLLNKRKVMRFLPADEGTREDRGYTHAEIQQILDQCDERSRVIILLMASTGMRIGAIPTLQYSDLVKIEKYGIYRISVYANSRKDRYYTFCTPECAKAIDLYLDYRRRFGENPITPNAPLVREQFDVNDLFQTRRPKSIGEEGCLRIIKRLLKRSGMRSNQVKQSHGLRKFFDTTCTTSGMSPLYVDMLMGHKTGLKGSYFKPTERDILEGNDKMTGYISVINDLTINEENRLRRQVETLTFESDKYSKLEEAVMRLQSIIEGS